MSDEYPTEWTPWIKHEAHEEPPATTNSRPISGLRSGCPDNTGWHDEDEHDAYPTSL
jgi:hypothetical protein